MSALCCCAISGRIFPTDTPADCGMPGAGGRAAGITVSSLVPERGLTGSGAGGSTAGLTTAERAELHEGRSRAGGRHGDGPVAAWRGRAACRRIQLLSVCRVRSVE